MKSRIENLEEQNKDLEEQLENLEDEKIDLENKLDQQRENNRFEAVKDQEISKRDAVISEKKDKIRQLEKELESSHLRERQYRKALTRIFHNEFIDILPKDEVEVIYKGDRYNVDELEGVQLSKYFLLTEKPEPDMKQVIEEFTGEGDSEDGN
ncbi:MAG: putative RNase H-like nuclease (RuvC/YqgF family) [Candidatus Nanohaloarchaea archaeon]|jgi:predicted RNase H-like nuclease (RuvC/YqgF family)